MVFLRIAVVDFDACNPNVCSLECIKYCPANRMGKECIVFEEDKIRISEEICNGCGICTHKCPNRAISIVNLKEERGYPVIRFGENGFILYNLAIPREGKAVGLVGENGCGKSTNISIVSGKLSPTYEIKSIEIREFFEKEYKVIVKPQNIFPNIEGNVKNLLENIDERGVLEEISEILLLEEIYDRDITVLSGGELQRVAIAATYLKEGDVYIFDEPLSFLDYKHRVGFLSVVESLLKEGKSVMIAEHDLPFLDYLCDYVHIFYGVSGVYGVVSVPYSTRVGINMFLSGYLKEENVRFRDRIDFKAGYEHDIEKLEYTSIPKFEIEYPCFKLENPNIIRLFETEIIGVVGQNGIGKSTFLRGVAEKLGIDIYKPQDPYIEFDGLVCEFIERYCNSSFSNTYIKAMDMERFLYRNMRTLSGGEQQKIAIMYVLSKELELYILDEPSAMLDVEARFKVLKQIRKRSHETKKGVIIVDHDIEFLEKVVDRVIIIDGIPGKYGKVGQPLDKDEGLNKFLESYGITYRRDEDTRRLRLNKRGSRRDRQQKRSGEFLR